MEPRTGGCQCGAVRYEITAEPKALAICFCSECQRQSGSAFGISLIVPKEGFRVIRGETGCFTRPTDSGSTLDGHFCPRCGTRLFHLPKRRPENVNVKPGTLDEPVGLAPSVAVWTLRQPAWLALPEGIARFERNPG